MSQNVFNDDGRQYLQMLQSAIERMASNSASCKAWMLTIVTAFMALQCSIRSLNGWVLLGILPIFLFWFLDAMYLKYERGFRNRQRDYVNRISEASSDEQRLKIPVYDFSILLKESDDEENGYKSTKGVWLSRSIIFFYLTPLLTVVVLFVVLNWSGIWGLF